jgi:Phycobilisome Linker polypeptide/Domain of unknown function (DUF4214)
MAKQWDSHEVLHLVNQIYQQVLERGVLRADGNSVDSSLMHYCDKLRRGEMSVRDVVRALGLSQEYAQRFIIPNTNANAVRFCYKHFLAREAEEKGLNYWAQQSMIGGWPVVIKGLVDSDEYTERFGNDAVPQ